MKKRIKNQIIIFALPVMIVAFMLAGISSADSLDQTKFYTVAPSPNSAGLWTIDPSTGATALVTSLTLPDGSAPDFMTNAVAFSPDNQLYGWDTARKQLYNVNYTSGQINYIGSPGTDATPQFVNGLAFNQQGDLYGLVGGNISQASSPSTLYTINTTTGAVSSVGNSYVNVTHSGLAVNFQTNELYGVTGLNNIPNHLLKFDPNAQPAINDGFSTNTTGDYTWSTQGSGTGYSYNSAGYVRMDGIQADYQVASVSAQRAMDLPSSGYAMIDFDINVNGAGQSRALFTLQQDANNSYRYILTDPAAGNQGIEKKVNGTTSVTTMPGSLTSTGSYLWEMWWNPTNLRMDLNGTTIQDISTSDTTIIDPASFIFSLYRFDGNLDSISIDPGLAQIVGDLGIRFNDVGVEFDPSTGKLYAVRDSDTLYSIDADTGQATEIGKLGNDVLTTNLAHPWQQAPVVPEPMSAVLFVAGGILFGSRLYFRKNNQCAGLCSNSKELND